MAVPVYQLSITELILTILKDGTSNVRCIVDKDSFQRSGPFKTYRKIIIDGPEEISQNAFYDCAALQEIYIGSSVDTIQVEFARFCYQLKTITVDSSNNYFESDEYGSLYNRGCTILYRSPPNRETMVLSPLLTSILTQALGATTYNYLEIPKKVTSIAASVALDSTIKELVFASDSVLENLGTQVFEINNIGSVQFAANLKSIGINCFRQAKALKKIVFPSNSLLTTFGASALSLCTGLETVELPPMLTAISSNLFQGCTLLANLYIGKSVSSISSDAFSGCAALFNITVNPSNTFFMVSTEGALVNKAETQVYVIPPTVQSFKISKTIVKIGKTSLQLCPDLKTLDIDPLHGEYVQNTQILINKNTKTALAIVGGATSVTIPNTVTKIDEYCAYQCKKLASIAMSSNLNMISNYAFQGCSSLVSVSIPALVTDIGSYAFDQCRSLTHVTFSSSGNIAFGSYAFNEAVNLEELVFDCAVRAVSYYSFRACGAKRVLFNNGNLAELYSSTFAYMNRLETIQFPSTLKNISYGVCFNSNVKTITFKGGNNIERIEQNAFAGCTKLESFEFSKSLSQIDTTAFSGCTSLSLVTFHNDCPMVELSSSSIFQGCTSLEKVNFSPNLRKVDSSVFQGCVKLQWFNVTSSSSYIKSINGILYDNNNNLILCPTGHIHASIDPNTVSFATRCFYGCSVLKSINIASSNSLRYIADYTFYQCSNLTEISFPLSVAEISNSAFLECSSLATVTFSANCQLKVISEATFKSCTKLSTINLEQCTVLQTISASAFADCTALSFIKIPSLVTEIEQSAFSGCTNLERVSFPDGSSLKSIGEESFSGCKHLEIFEFPETVQSIGSGCFKDCMLNGMLRLPGSVEQIGDQAFFGCDIQKVFYCGISEFAKNPFDSDFRAFVQMDYKFGVIFQVPAERALDHDCVMITAAGERRFSVAQEILIASVVIADNIE